MTSYEIFSLIIRTLGVIATSFIAIFAGRAFLNWKRDHKLKINYELLEKLNLANENYNDQAQVVMPYAHEFKRVASSFYNVNSTEVIKAKDFQLPDVLEEFNKPLKKLFILYKEIDFCHRRLKALTHEEFADLEFLVSEYISFEMVFKSMGLLPFIDLPNANDTLMQDAIEILAECDVEQLKVRVSNNYQKVEKFVDENLEKLSQ
jgi:hypothetical protein